MGSSHGLTRIIRLAYFEGAQYVPLLKRAHQLWKETGDKAGMQLLYVTGSIDIAPEGDGFVESSLQSCIEHGLPHEVLDSKEIEKRFPAFKLTPKHKGMWQPDGGFVASERAMTRWHFSPAALPFGCDVRRGPRSYLEIHFGETVAVLSVIVIQVVLLAALLVIGVPPDRDPLQTHLELLLLRVALGPVAALAMSAMIRRVLAIPQTMAATGLFYIATLAVLVGELLGRYFTFRTGLPL